MTNTKKNNSGEDKQQQQQVEMIKANDGDALQSLFGTICDDDGLMTKDGFMAIPMIARLLDDEDLLVEELNEFWNAAPKFPDVDGAAKERIDVDSFVQIYRDIDDLFEDDVDDGGSEQSGDATKVVPSNDETKQTASGAEVSTGEIGSEESSGLADDVLESIFDRSCDADGLMTKEALAKIPIIAQVLKDEDLLMDELNDIWGSAPKFPDVKNVAEERIDVDSFIQIYRDIDDLFEDDDDDDAEDDIRIVNNKKEASPEVLATSPPITSSQKDTPVATSDDDDEDDEELEKEEHELELVYKNIVSESKTPNNGLVSKTDLLNWDEVKQLIRDDMLSKEEFEDLWDNTAKLPGAMGEMCLDVEGFLSFNVALNDLFVFEDDDDDDIAEVVDITNEETVEKAVDETHDFVVTEEDLDPETLFSLLTKNTNNPLSLNDLTQRWGELQEMLSEGDLMKEELRAFFDKAPKAPGNDNKLDKDGFVVLYDSIDSLFEDDDDDKEVENMPPPPNPKTTLLNLFSRIQQAPSAIDDNSPALPCGLEASDNQREQILSIISSMESDATANALLNRRVGEKELSGEWELVYTSSGMMVFNKGLSGLGGSFPNGRFGGLTQSLRATKYTADVEYKERIDTSSASGNDNEEEPGFDVTVTGTWELKNSVSLLSGSPTIVMAVEPDKVTYGPTSTRADHWKSVRSMNLLDVTYLDEDLRVMRGCTSTDTLFIFRRIK
eukprot:CAMPEP_0172498678 /NCGR_PEP_ID=MMETSP1066-20121228/115742_1 /TAXON_ID=671091 /ORGANISM="Coscinodiscus wailesii, Strain CCMP2513" /LENGTH=723 /DNA_ID=CAMNT_0013272061 /DNA_START=444 /DNA_END=2615 /DNA_ORIENTATION=-